MESASFSDGNVGERPACLIPSGRVKRRYTEAILVTFRNGFMHVDPLYDSHNGRLINVKSSLVSVDIQFIHHEAPYVRDSDAFLCYK